MDIIYEKAVPADLDELCSVIKRAVEKMDSMGIFQWTRYIPTVPLCRTILKRVRCMWAGQAAGSLLCSY